MAPYPPNAHEALGYWIIPISLSCGSVLMLTTTAIIRFCLKTSSRVQARI
jgi:hypothetical protein